MVEGAVTPTKRPRVAVRSFTELVERWLQRDTQYSRRELTREEVAAIVANRTFEARFVEPTHRAEAYSLALAFGEAETLR